MDTFLQYLLIRFLIWINKYLSSLDHNIFNGFILIVNFYLLNCMQGIHTAYDLTKHSVFIVQMSTRTKRYETENN